MNDMIQVGVRVRPLNPKEIIDGEVAAYKCDINEKSVIQVKSTKGSEQAYFYDQIFDEYSTTRQIYDKIAMNIVDDVISGLQGTIFACKLQINYNCKFKNYDTLPFTIV